MRGLVSVLVLASLAMGGAAQAQVLANSQYAAPVQVGVPTHPSYTVESFAPAASIAIKGTGVRFRAEPFATKETPVLSSGSTGLALNVVGIVRMPDWNWYQVVLKSGQKAFIRSDLTSAPSRGGATTAAAASITPVSPVSPTAPTIYAAPVQPSSPTPVVQPTPTYKPAAPAPALPPAQSPFDNSAISLTPRSSPPPATPDWSQTPARTSDPSGLLSVPPGQ